MELNRSYDNRKRVADYLIVTLNFFKPTVPDLHNGPATRNPQISCFRIDRSKPYHPSFAHPPRALKRERNWISMDTPA